MNWFVRKIIKAVLAIVIAIAALETFFWSSESGQLWKNAFCLLASALAVAALGCYLKYFVPLRKEEGFPFAYVNSDGSVRELTQDEQEYLNTKFPPGDGGRPYIKNRYNQKRFDGGINGFIYRNRVPREIKILPVPPEADF